MRRHTLIGERIVLATPSVAPTAGLVRSSHERFDGTGYPDALVGGLHPARLAHHRGLRRLRRDGLPPPYRAAISSAEALVSSAAAPDAVRSSGRRGVLRGRRRDRHCGTGSFLGRLFAAILLDGLAARTALLADRWEAERSRRSLPVRRSEPSGGRRGPLRSAEPDPNRARRRRIASMFVTFVLKSLRPPRPRNGRRTPRRRRRRRPSR